MRPPGPRKVKWHLAIPEEIAAKIDLLTLDEFTGRPGMGARSILVSRLLVKYLQELEEERRTEE